MKFSLDKTNSRLNKIFSIFFVLLLAFFFRLYGFNWDSGQHLHPDERFLTMVLTAIKIPNSFLTYLNPQISPMNPYNNNFSFFVYGTFPINLTKVVGVLSSNNDYGNIHLVGRILSSLFDIGTVFLVYLVAMIIYPQKSLNTKYKIQNTALLAAFLYSTMVLPIQLSHFFAVDTFLNFFIVLSFYFLVLLISSFSPSPLRKLLTFNPELAISFALGVSFGLALACKISAALFAPIIGLAFLAQVIFFLTSNQKCYRKIFFVFIPEWIVFCLTTLIVFRVSQPQAFSSGNFLNWQLNPQFIDNLKELKNLSSPNSWFPPSVQWHSTKPIIFPLKNLVLWGMGLPLGIISIVAIGYAVATLLSGYFTKSLNTKYLILNTLAVLWILGLFIYQGVQFCKTMRYLLPIYPFLALLAANFMSDVFRKTKLSPIVQGFWFLIFLIYPFSFLSIYSRPVTRVTASKWIYENIPAGATVTYEEWDDGLPLGILGYPPREYKVESLFMYDFDTPEKWQKINEKLAKVDYYFITSNRAYGSIMKLPDKYPQTTAFYQSLFNGSGDFEKIAEFTSYPCFPPFGDKHWFCLNDDSAEEAFTVYDHPKVMIFRKNER